MRWEEAGSPEPLRLAGPERGAVVDRVDLLLGVAAAARAGHVAGEAAEAGGGGVEAGGAGARVRGEEAHGAALVVVVLVHGPRLAARHDDRLGAVVVVELRRVVVGELLVPDEVVVEVDVDGVVLPVVRRPREPEAAGLVVEGRGHVLAVVVPVGPVVGGARGVAVVVLLGVEEPHAGEAAAADPVVHVVGAQLWDVVDGADAVAAAAVVVVAGEDLAGRLAAEVPGGGRPAAQADAGGRGEAEHGEETGQEEHRDDEVMTVQVCILSLGQLFYTLSLSQRRFLSNHNP